ncbi:MAG: hypothetical protein IJ757_07245 [Clostridiales bacterium]|nr:hypothetical protein [Clostridiales bacterium]
MEIAGIYIIITAITVALIAGLIGLLIALFVRRKRNHSVTAVAASLVALVLITGSLIMWRMSHGSYPEINDWSFIGTDISRVEQSMESSSE